MASSSSPSVAPGTVIPNDPRSSPASGSNTGQLKYFDSTCRFRRDGKASLPCSCCKWCPLDSLWFEERMCLVAKGFLWKLPIDSSSGHTDLPTFGFYPHLTPSDGYSKRKCATSLRQWLTICGAKLFLKLWS